MDAHSQREIGILKVSPPMENLASTWKNINLKAICLVVINDFEGIVPLSYHVSPQRESIHNWTNRVIKYVCLVEVDLIYLRLPKYSWPQLWWWFVNIKYLTKSWQLTQKQLGLSQLTSCTRNKDWELGWSTTSLQQQLRCCCGTATAEIFVLVLQARRQSWRSEGAFNLGFIS